MGDKIQKIYIGDNWQVRPEKHRTPGSDIKLYYSFNTDILSTSYDSVGNNNGTWNNNYGYKQVLGTNLCCDMKNTEQYLSVPTTFTFPTTNFTISVWIRPDSGYSVMMVFNKRNGNNSTNAYPSITINGNGEIYSEIPWESGNVVKSQEGGYNDNKWHNVMLIKQGDNYSLYIDNHFEESNTNSFSIHGGSSTQGRIGCNIFGYNNQYYGLIDEFIVSDEAWDATKRADYYKKTMGQYQTSSFVN